ncbi:aldo/keto reductase [Thermoplasma sp. Kam2015]|uniref:aldo/keto reductase n=1 Tax=Thermoplasma sp. Kam2015 TaxID=2094122 RepID=UPI000D9A9871|nr:aldo/keto reductase [Thermoplasma sp. Kam2015]PYB68943.1 aldo/keto reductase [Thermoplasma sp. Kam2015]
MKYVRLGNSGTMVSQVAIGTWHLPGSGKYHLDGVEKVDEAEFYKIVRRAYDVGINFFDTANIYHGRVEKNEDHIDHIGNSERILGRTLKGYDRESIVVATKVRGPVSTFPNGEGLSRKHIMWQIRESLNRLDMDYVDLYQMHWPDPNTPHLETMTTLSHLVDLDLVRYTGESNHSASDIEDFMKLSEDHRLHSFVTMQEPYNILQRDIEKDKLKVAVKYGLGLLAYIPLAQGVLTGKYLKTPESGSRSSYYPELIEFSRKNEKVVRDLLEIAKEKDITGSQLAIAWLIKRSEIEKIPIIPLLGVTREAYLDENLAALDVKLSDDDMERIDKITSGLVK